MSSSRKTEIVIIGGTSGAMAARAISKATKRFNPATHNLTLISQLPYTVFLVSTARMAITSDGAFDETSASSKTGGLLPFDKLFDGQTNGRKFVQAKVTAVHETAVDLEDGRSVPFDYLVVATGSTWAGAMNFDYRTDAEVKGHLAEWRKKVSTAKNIVIAGGGAVGVELAGEIRHYYPRAALTLVHTLPKLLNPTYNDSFRNSLGQKVSAAGVRLVLGDRVLNLPNEGLSAIGEPHLLQLTTETGRTLEADLVIPAFGPSPNTSILRTLRSGAALNTNGRVRVTSTFNVLFPNKEVSPNIFAIGDIIDWPEQHTVAKAEGHANIVAENVLRALEGKRPEDGKVWKGMPEMILITFGPTGGKMYLPFFGGFSFGDWAARMIKSKTLFVPMFRGKFGLP